MPVHPPTGNHFIVCGDGPLAYRITLELTSRYGEEVVVVLPERAKNHGPQISALAGVAVLERAELTSETFVEAGVATARALALVWQDDLGNFHAGLRAQELNPELRLVLAVFSRSLGDQIRGLFHDCTVLSGSAMAAPSFVAAALGEPAPIRVRGRTLYVARREDTDPGHVVCQLAVSDDPAAATRLLPPDAAEHDADLVLAVADGTPRDPLTTQRHLVRTALGMLYRLTWNRFGFVFAILLSAAIAGYCLLLPDPKDNGGPINSIYLAVMSMTGSAFTGSAGGAATKWSQVILTIDGMALIPVVTALIVGAQLTGSIRGEPRPRGGHVIVVGLGNVGTRIIGALHDLGVNVACVDKNPNARGIAMARRNRLPVVIGEAYQEATLRAAGLDTAIALVSVTDSDIVNLQTALRARATRQDLRLVVSLYDDDLAQRVQKTVGNLVSRSVSYMAAPAFAVALLEHQVQQTIAIGRHVLLIAEIRVEPGADIAGQAVTELDGVLARVLALQLNGSQRYDWSPHRGYLLSPGDWVIVLATRAGLSRFLAGNRPAVSSL